MLDWGWQEAMWFSCGLMIVYMYLVLSSKFITSFSLVVVGSVSDRTLFPETLQSELSITHISFNPVPKTDMRRLLNTISDSELGPDAVRAKSHIISLSESCDGDIRTAVNTLQFTYCQPSSTNNGTQSKKTLVSGSSRKRAKSASTSGIKMLFLSQIMPDFVCLIIFAKSQSNLNAEISVLTII